MGWGETLTDSVLKTRNQGTKLTFFSRSHFAFKYFKVAANSKKLVASFIKKKTFYSVILEELDPPES